MRSLSRRERRARKSRVPMHLDLMLPIATSLAFDRPEQMALIRLAEDLSFSRLWVRDILLQTPEDPDLGSGFEIFCAFMQCLRSASVERPGGATLKLLPGKPEPMPDLWIACRPAAAIAERLGCTRFLMPFLSPAAYGEGVCAALAADRTIRETAMQFFLDCDPDYASSRVQLVRRGTLPIVAGHPRQIADFLLRYRGLGLGTAIACLAGRRPERDQMLDLERHVIKAVA